MRARARLYGLDYHASEQDLRQALDLATQVGLSWLVQQCSQGRLDLLLATGQIQEAQATLADLKHTVAHSEMPSDELPHERFCSLSRSHGEGWVTLYEGKIAFVRQELEAAEHAFSNAALNADQGPKESLAYAHPLAASTCGTGSRERR
ncbi:hypothetical protein KSX_00430 [Ktedonospora formicarum]|uniref:Uncharacterized protein n=2 Tax=Ktedonospora formicarum TaxID=2778364 RepID=A0A8J3HVR1_9CHLR|nr:hypothetical protein KSX_00430 [Ktedonospora formicarum]